MPICQATAQTGCLKTGNITDVYSFSLDYIPVLVFRNCSLKNLSKTLNIIIFSAWFKWKFLLHLFIWRIKKFSPIPFPVLYSGRNYLRYKTHFNYEGGLLPTIRIVLLWFWCSFKNMFFVHPIKKFNVDWSWRCITTFTMPHFTWTMSPFKNNLLSPCQFHM